MKTLIAVLLLTASCAFAYEKPNNPDRFMSVGLELFKGQEAGILRQGVNGAQTNGGTTGGKLDIRLPLTSNLTLSAFGENTGINNNKDYSEGYRVGVGLRIYIKD